MRKQLLKWMSLGSIALAVLLFAVERAAADDDDPPSRVARLAYTNGNISFNPAGTDDWVAAVVNRPMTTGDKLWSDDRSRAELHLDTAVIRLSDHTGFSFLNLSDEITQLRLTEGTLYIRVRRLGDDETFEVDTPNLAFSILRPGRYRINVNEAGDATIVAVRDGQGEVTSGGSAYAVHAREEGVFNGTDQLDADVERIRYDEDEFDQWCNERDRRDDHSVSSRYVSDDVVGYEDLDEYGGWRAVPEYGNVWFPHTVVVGWAPYRYGHWVWIAPWGWTWVDNEPWGFAPFHYGRWVAVGGVWGWVPCPPRPAVVTVAYVRPVYAPALVAWVGHEREIHLIDDRVRRRRTLGSRRGRWQCASHRRGVVPLGTARRLLPVVPREPDLRHQRQRFEHYHHQQNASHQRLQQRLREQDGERHECEVSKPDCAQRGNRCFAPDLRFCATRSQ